MLFCLNIRIYIVPLDLCLLECENVRQMVEFQIMNSVVETLDDRVIAHYIIIFTGIRFATCELIINNADIVMAPHNVVQLNHYPTRLPRSDTIFNPIFELTLDKKLRTPIRQ